MIPTHRRLSRCCTPRCQPAGVRSIETVRSSALATFCSVVSVAPVPPASCLASAPHALAESRVASSVSSNSMTSKMMSHREVLQRRRVSTVLRCREVQAVAPPRNDRATHRREPEDTSSAWSGWGDSNSRPPAPKSGNGGVSANAVSCRISPFSYDLAAVMSGRHGTTRTGRHQPVQPGLIHSRYRADPRGPSGASAQITMTFRHAAGLKHGSERSGPLISLGSDRAATDR